MHISVCYVCGADIMCMMCSYVFVWHAYECHGMCVEVRRQVSEAESHLPPCVKTVFLIPAIAYCTSWRLACKLLPLILQEKHCGYRCM